MSAVPTTWTNRQGRDLLVIAYRMRWRLLLRIMLIMGLAFGIAANVHPKWPVKSSLLMLLGNEYAFRPTAGENSAVNAVFDHDQILATELAILTSPNLHRQVIEKIGVERIYPEYFAKESAIPQPIADLMKTMRAWLARVTGAAPAAPAKAVDPMTEAAEQFSANLTVTPSNKAAVIELTFSHKDPKIAVEALSTLQDAYFAERRRLFANQQSRSVTTTVTALAAQLADAEAALAIFKSKHNISGFVVQREMLQREQGDAEIQLTQANGLVQQARSRLEALRGQTSLPAEIRMGQLRMDQATLAGRLDIAKAEVDLKAASAQPKNLEVRVATINRDLRALNGVERELQQLQRARDLLDDSYRSAFKIRDDRLLSEHASADNEAAVRVVSAPTAPSSATPLGQIIIAVGAVASLLFAVLSVLFVYLFGTRFVMPDSIEDELGIAILAVIPSVKIRHVRQIPFSNA